MHQLKVNITANDTHVKDKICSLFSAQNKQEDVQAITDWKASSTTLPD